MRFAVVLMLFVTSVSCGDPASQDPVSEQPPQTSVIETVTREVAQDQTFSYSDHLDQVEPDVGLFAAQTVLLGEIRSVNGPFWNQDSGQKWEYDDGTGSRRDGDYTTPFMYYQVGVSIERTLADDLDLAGPVIEFLVPAFQIEDVDGPVPVGLFSVSDRVVVGLAIDIFYMRAEPVLALRLFHGTAFHVADDETVRSWSLLANEQARADNPDVAPIDEKPVELGMFVERVSELRSESHPEWESYRPIEKETEEQLRGIIDYLETGTLPSTLDRETTTTSQGD